MNGEPDENGDGSIDFERSTFEHGAEPWKDPAVLRQLYHEHDLSQEQVAEELDTTQQNIQYWMDKLDVEARLPMHERDRSISRIVREDGRVQYHIPDGDGGTVYLYESQIVALAIADLGLIFDEDSEVDHLLKSPIKLNIVENLAIRSTEDHRKRHGNERGALPNTTLFDFLYGEPEDEETPEFFERLDQWGQWWVDIEGVEEVHEDSPLNAD
ncbi:hypothetical protein [Halorientalis sp. IM1011]|uniref:hypothetical protein n=1 Tax=Halorientalis sp. IM1011 TaxID=1932360 RepID=UPI0012F77A69|nr:hypothetical protein [Halorientalis sp. IM1011]